MNEDGIDAFINVLDSFIETEELKLQHATKENYVHYVNGRIDGVKFIKTVLSNHIKTFSA